QCTVTATILDKATADNSLKGFFDTNAPPRAAVRVWVGLSYKSAEFYYTSAGTVTVAPTDSPQITGVTLDGSMWNQGVPSKIYVSFKNFGGSWNSFITYSCNETASVCSVIVPQSCTGASSAGSKTIDITMPESATNVRFKVCPIKPGQTFAAGGVQSCPSTLSARGSASPYCVLSDKFSVESRDSYTGAPTINVTGHGCISGQKVYVNGVQKVCSGNMSFVQKMMASVSGLFVWLNFDWLLKK
ncbi:MAG: hypothetical protein NT041_01490, partial [Candidatus Vogelbacteria bacterium]|nr:hypothetical protein [Candidatus Vogelbacteria bacterium]